jgi:hypothetical protein
VLQRQPTTFVVAERDPIEITSRRFHSVIEFISVNRQIPPIIPASGSTNSAADAADGDLSKAMAGNSKTRGCFRNYHRPAAET